MSSRTLLTSRIYDRSSFYLGPNAFYNPVDISGFVYHAVRHYIVSVARVSWIKTNSLTLCAFRTPRQANHSSYSILLLHRRFSVMYVHVYLQYLWTLRVTVCFEICNCNFFFSSLQRAESSFFKVFYTFLLGFLPQYFTADKYLIILILKH